MLLKRFNQFITENLDSAENQRLLDLGLINLNTPLFLDQDEIADIEPEDFEDKLEADRAIIDWFGWPTRLQFLNPGYRDLNGTKVWQLFAPLYDEAELERYAEDWEWASPEIDTSAMTYLGDWQSSLHVTYWGGELNGKKIVIHEDDNQGPYIIFNPDDFGDPLPEADGGYQQSIMKST
jgi:hypothetical protein